MEKRITIRDNQNNEYLTKNINTQDLEIMIDEIAKSEYFEYKDQLKDSDAFMDVQRWTQRFVKKVVDTNIYTANIISNIKDELVKLSDRIYHIEKEQNTLTSRSTGKSYNIFLILVVLSQLVLDIFLLYIIFLKK